MSEMTKAIIYDHGGTNAGTNLLLRGDGGMLAAASCWSIQPDAMLSFVRNPLGVRPASKKREASQPGLHVVK